jgi:hypothetical protein
VLKYQRAESLQTLEEGLGEYYASREGLVQGRGISPAAREFFRCHDVAHVVFGCNTTLVNEGIVKVWSFFGTTGGSFRLLRAYRLLESQEIYAQLAWSDIVSASFRLVAVVPLVLWRSLRMRKRWPWSQFDSYLAMPLADLRREFGIELVLR